MLLKRPIDPRLIVILRGLRKRNQLTLKGSGHQDRICHNNAALSGLISKIKASDLRRQRRSQCLEQNRTMTKQAYPHHALASGRIR